MKKGFPPKKTVVPAAPIKKPVALARKPIFGFEMSALRQAIKEARVRAYHFEPKCIRANPLWRM